MGARNAKSNPCTRAPIPHGWDFEAINRSLLIESSSADYVPFVKDFGFVAHIDESSSGDTPGDFAAAVDV